MCNNEHVNLKPSDYNAKGWGFRIDINGASAGSEAGLGESRVGGTNLGERKEHLVQGKYLTYSFGFLSLTFI